ncbi:hypothetical protein C6558_37125 [Ensifer sp. NM-2]|nr:hypothetical protein [Ensifer canadensis]PSS59617.1 hypothetical protein C6558_37125 [Ensifer sp. NM-2]
MRRRRQGLWSPQTVSPMTKGSRFKRKVMRRQSENLDVVARSLPPVKWAGRGGIAGRYWSEELETYLGIETRDGATYAVFEGMLGTGPMEPIYPLSDEIWTITTRRLMDAAPPGDWSVQAHRDAGGIVTDLTVGCWLQRKISYQRVR